MKLLAPIFIFIIIGITSCYNSLLIKSISKKEVVECYFIGESGHKSKLYGKFERLRNNTSKEKLFKLTNDSSAVLATYSSYALIDLDLIEPEKLFKNFLSKDQNVQNRCGCINSNTKISTLIYRRYLNTRVDFSNTDDSENYTINDSKSLQTLDSLILFLEEPDWYLLNMIFENRIYADEYKSKIEELAFEKKNHSALEYVFNNLKLGNKEKLIQVSKEILEDKNSYYNQLQLAREVLNKLSN